MKTLRDKRRFSADRSIRRHTIELLQGEDGVDASSDDDRLWSELFGGSSSGAVNGHRSHPEWARSGFEAVGGSLQEIAEGAIRRAGNDFRSRTRLVIRIGDGLGFGGLHVVEGVGDALAVGDVEVSELLDDGTDLGEVFELQGDAGVDGVTDELALGRLVVEDRRDGVAADLGRCGINAIVAHQLANLFGSLRRAIIRSLGRALLCSDVELNDGGVGRSFVLAVGAGGDAVEDGRLLRGCEDCGTEEKSESDPFHDVTFRDGTHVVILERESGGKLQKIEELLTG